MNYVTEWILSVIYAAIACGFMETAVPEGNMKSFLDFIFSMVFINVLISPIELIS